MSTQIRLVCSCPQSNQDWLSFHDASQSQGRRCEASDGDHARQPEAQPFCLLPQLHELGGLLREQQAQSHRISKPPSFLHVSAPRHRKCPRSVHLLCSKTCLVALVLSSSRRSWESSRVPQNPSKNTSFKIVFNSPCQMLKVLRCTVVGESVSNYCLVQHLGWFLFSEITLGARMTGNLGRSFSSRTKLWLQTVLRAKVFWEKPSS